MLVKSSPGFTLIELVVVIVIIAIIGSFTVTRLDTVLHWKVNGNLREFADTWQFLANEALGRRERYRLVIQLDTNSYLVRREIKTDNTTVSKVDFLKKLRLKSEQERRAKKEEEQLLSLEKEFSEDDVLQNRPLDFLFYRFIFEDPEEDIRLAVPLEFPNLAQTKTLNSGLRFRDVKIGGEEIKTGEAVLRFSSRGGSPFALVHLETSSSIYTALMNPVSGEVTLKAGDIDFEQVHESMQ